MLAKNVIFSPKSFNKFNPLYNLWSCQKFKRPNSSVGLYILYTQLNSQIVGTNFAPHVADLFLVFLLKSLHAVSLLRHVKFLMLCSLLSNKLLDRMVHQIDPTAIQDMSHDMTKPTKLLCAQRRLRSAWASAQSDQSLRCALKG